MNLLPNALKIKTEVFRKSQTSSIKPDTSVVQYYIEEKHPLISVVVPVFREEKIIESTLKIYTPELKKKYNFELIVSDGGSDDLTVEIAKEFADKLVEHTDNRRQTIAEGRNCGAKLAEGEILVFINGDTMPNNPDKFFEFIKNWSLYGFGYSGSLALACPVSIRKDEILIKDRIFYFLHNSYVRLLNVIGLGMGRGECQIVRKDAFDRVGGYNSKIAAGEDFDLYRRIGKFGKISFAKELLVYESPRRFRKYGYLRILGSWTLNSLSVWFRGKSVSNEWEAVR